MAMASHESEIVGVDVGASSSMVVCASGEIIRNELGGHSSASLVGFFGNERYVGEAGVSQLSTNAKNTILVGEILSANACLEAHYRFAKDLTVDYAGAEKTFRKESLLAALLKKLASLKGGSSSIFALAAPPCWSDDQCAVLRLSARAARLEAPFLFRSSECLRRTYAQKHAPSVPANESRLVAIVDVGRCSATCTVAEFDSHGERRTFATSSTQDGAGTAALDAALFDFLVAKKLSLLSETTGNPITPGTKKGSRLLGAVERLRKLLSTMKEAKVTCENLGNDCDVALSITRDEFREAAAKVLADLKALLSQCREDTLAKAKEAGLLDRETFDSVEVLGGGGRVAVFRELIADVFQVPEDSLGAKLDDASVAHGAALLAADERERANVAAAAAEEAKKLQAEVEASLAAAAAAEGEGDGDAQAQPPSGPSSGAAAEAEEEEEAKEAAAVLPPPSSEQMEVDEEPKTPMEDETWRTLAELEDEMCARDAAVAFVAERRNALETLILELRSASSAGPHAALLSSDDLRSAVDEAEQWLWDSADNDDPEPFASKYNDLDSLAKELCPAYFEAVEADKKKVEADMEAEAKNDDDPDGLDDDERHEDRLNADTRKLKFSDRFRLVQKNKDEGTELFKGGNVHHAIKRYRDALAHAAKFVGANLSPDQEHQVSKIKLDLHINVALCWSKLDNVDQSLRACNEALKLDDKHPKALYRRAVAYDHLKRFDDAKADVTNALANVPEDKALLALQKRVDAQIARQKKKEKDMWGKAFKK